MSESKQQRQVWIITGSRAKTQKRGAKARLEGVDNAMFNRILGSMKTVPSVIITHDSTGVAAQAFEYAKANGILCLRAYPEYEKYAQEGESQVALYAANKEILDLGQRFKQDCKVISFSFKRDKDNSPVTQHLARRVHNETDWPMQVYAGWEPKLLFEDHGRRHIAKRDARAKVKSA